MKKNAKYAESLMMTYGYDPELSEGSIKPPIFQTSTFVFKTAEEGKAFFEVTSGSRPQKEAEQLGLIYSRMNNPNLEMLEERLCLWDEAAACAVFASGMAAISTVLLRFLKPGDLLVHSLPLYGGTDHFINHYLKDIGVESLGFRPDHSKSKIIEMIKKSGKADKLALIYVETPANPTNSLIDIGMSKEVADYFSNSKKQVYVAADNTYMGPLWSQPLRHGADLVMYSATKYIGGHSDLIAGAVLGAKDLIKQVKSLRTYLGSMASPETCWLMLRSLETLKVRMQKQAKNAKKIAQFLARHPKVKSLYYLGNLDKNSKAHAIFKRQYTSPGAMISFEIRGGEAAAFRFLNKVKLMKLAVSLGSTESLAQHPSTMTHCSVDAKLRAKMGITDGLIRLSVGIEHHEDLITDIEQALRR